jgi:predicted O-linked N-acetylglucosamine transferase (SPINDLY family)
MKRFGEALASYDRALALRPNHAESLNNRGATLRALKRSDDALASYDQAIAARPDYADALNNRGNICTELGRYEEAIASYDRALVARPNYAEALNNRGIILNELKRYDEALTSLDRALSIQPNNAQMHNNHGIALLGLKRFDEALAGFDRAIAARSDYAEALNNRGIVLHELGRADEALESYERAVTARPDYAEALDNRGGILVELRRFKEALESFERALTAKPDDPHAFSGAANCALNLCDWNRSTQFKSMLPDRIHDRKASLPPFILLGYTDDPALQLQGARNYVNQTVPPAPRQFWTGQTWRHDRLRVAYLCADFRAHPGAYLLGGIIEMHDRSNFEVIGISVGPDDRSVLRQRLAAAFDVFHDVRTSSDEEIAKLLHELQVDIAIDRDGHTRESRPGILAYRPAPIQASFLGYAGTTGTRFIDYIVADKFVAPFEHRQFYSEQIVHLPDCYQANDYKRGIGAHTPTRREVGLPEHGFVYCCFNNNWKITPAVFDVWMRLLHRVEGSVLWLFRDNEGAQENLCREATRRGIDPSRLVFAERLPNDLHLARHRLADLFLDTFPCNAHTTGSDALWVGLPVLTCIGRTFAARVAASLLHAVGLPELIVADLGEYEALALKLARDPALLADTKAKLQRNLTTHPLFDTGRFTRGLEAAYRTMWEIWQRGEAPRSFAVAGGGNASGQVPVEPSP